MNIVINQTYVKCDDYTFDLQFVESGQVRVSVAIEAILHRFFRRKFSVGKYKRWVHYYLGLALTHSQRNGDRMNSHQTPRKFV